MRRKMETITLTIYNLKIKQEIINFLQHFPETDIELTTLEDIDDLRLLKNTRYEESISFSEYLENAN